MPGNVRVKAAIFQRYDINKETYQRRFRLVKPLENETPVGLAILVKDLVEKWLKGCGDRPAVVDAVVKEQFMKVLPDEVKVSVKGEKALDNSGGTQTGRRLPSSQEGRIVDASCKVKY